MRPMRIDAILLEVEGIVVDTLVARREAIADSMRPHGVTLSDAEYWEWCAGWPTASAIATIARERDLPLDATDLELAALRADRAFATSLSKGTTLADGARSAIERLSGRHRLAVVSRLPRSVVEVILELARLDHAFAFVIGAEDAPRAKPDPAPYHLARQRLGRYRGGASGVVVALENGAAGIRSARAAGFPCLAVGAQPAHVALEAVGFVPHLAALDTLTLATLIDPPH